MRAKPATITNFIFLPLLSQAFVATPLLVHGGHQPPLSVAVDAAAVQAKSTLCRLKSCGGLPEPREGYEAARKNGHVQVLSPKVQLLLSACRLNGARHFLRAGFSNGGRGFIGVNRRLSIALAKSREGGI